MFDRTNGANRKPRSFAAPGMAPQDDDLRDRVCHGCVTAGLLRLQSGRNGRGARGGVVGSVRAADDVYRVVFGGAPGGIYGGGGDDDHGADEGGDVLGGGFGHQ